MNYSTLIDAVIKTRQIMANLVTESLVDLNDVPETEVRDRILAKMARQPELYPQGWYDPPAGGVAVLTANKPFEHIKFDTLRNPNFFPNKKFSFRSESVGVIYVSPIHRSTGMIGDLGCTIYHGFDDKIKEHIKNTYQTILKVAETAEVGMSFKELYGRALKIFGNESRMIAWMTTNHDPLKKNLGHTVPGSYESLSFGSSFEEIRESIRSQRVYIIELEEFIIPKDVAFTVEARLVDPQRPELPNVFFHFIVTFLDGNKKILDNLDVIFRSAKMDYML